jgi:hypothetical protein
MLGPHLAHAFYVATGVATPRCDRCFDSGTSYERIWHLLRHDHRARVVDAHWLAKERHLVGQDLTLVMIRETETSPSPAPWSSKV